MSLVAVVGECSTTTALGLAATWPDGERAVVVEFDPAGGCLSAWLEVPRQPSLSDLAASASSGSWPTIESMVQTSPTGVEVLVAPTRSVEAAAAIVASSPMLPVVSALDLPVVIADGGRLRSGLSALTVQAGVVVVAHRQHAGSAAAATVGLERVGDLCDLLTVRSIPFVVALIGDRPYGADEVGTFVGADVVVELAVDPWAAAVLAGRSGSRTRLKRSPLWRSLGTLSSTVSAQLRQSRDEALWTTQAAEQVSRFNRSEPFE